MPSAIIIGAGMAGLAAAHELNRHGFNVIVLDKGRGVGGRLATRRIDSGRADHGAQYFSARTSEFQGLVQELQQAGLVREWKLPDTDGTFTHPRFIGADGMNAIAKYLAQQISVQTNERAIRIESLPTGGCRVSCESGNTFEADSLLITAPVPQAIALLQDSGLPINGEMQEAFAAVEYEPCIAVLVSLSEPSRIPSPGFLRFDDEDAPVAWVVDNQQKGISPAQPLVTIHAGHAFSRAHLEDDLPSVGQYLIDQLKDYLPASSITSYQTHRWRYSLASKRYAAPFLAGEADFPMLFGGDGFGMGNVEGAYQSGLQMARHLLESN